MKQKTVAMVLAGLLVLTLAGCSGSPLDKPTSSNKGDVTSDSTPTTGADTSKGADKEPKPSDATGDATDETTIMGEVANIDKDTITLSSVRERPQTTDNVTSGSPAPGSSSSTGETKEIKVASDTVITLKSGESGVLSDIKVGNILTVQMSGDTVKSITVEATDSGEPEPDKSAPAPDSKTDTPTPAPSDGSPSLTKGSSKP